MAKDEEHTNDSAPGEKKLRLPAVIEEYFEQYQDYDFNTCRTRIDRDGPYHEEDVIAAIHVTGGVFGAMARLLGRKRQSIKDYVYRNPAVLAEFENYRESCIDEVERGVMISALLGDAASQRFVLSTIGKDRGYTTKTEHSGAGGQGPVVMEIRRTIIDVPHKVIDHEDAEDA